MNLQLLDWFAKVARHGGISQAVRQLPHSIQQPTLSEHMAELEREVGTPLFVRHPFRLLDAGRELFRLVNPFLEELAPLIERLRDRRLHLRIAVSELVEPRLVSRLVTRLQVAHPGLCCSVSGAAWPEVGAALRLGEVDLALAARSEAEPVGLVSRDFAELPLALLVPEASALRDPEELWKQRPIAERLISPMPEDGVAQRFVRGLRLGSMQWPATIEVDSLLRTAELVAGGAGVGLTVAAPWLVRCPGVRVLPLAGFEPVRLAMFWTNTAPAIVRAAINELTTLAGGHRRTSAPRCRHFRPASPCRAW